MEASRRPGVIHHASSAAQEVLGLRRGRFTKRAFLAGLRRLARRDPDPATIAINQGPPPRWVRPPGFPTLPMIILEQRVSLASGRAAFERLRTTVTRVTPRRFLPLDDTALKAIGLSRQKTAYGRDLAWAILDRHLRPAALQIMSGKAARATLVRLKGIGVGSADG